jgi:type IV fimbrial biogenesis protein FimT
MTVVGILLAIAVPSFRYVTTANRASSEINALLGDMQMARAEAIKEGQFITICASTTGFACSGASAWNTGWIVFSNAPPLATLDVGDTILKVQGAFSGADALNSNHGITQITFNRDGFVFNLGSGFTFTLNDPTNNAQYTRCLSGTFVGAMSTQIGGKTTAEVTAGVPNTC